MRIEERYFPGSAQFASTLTDLGTLIHMRGDSGRSESYHRRALSIAEKVEENGPQIAGILNNLGESVLELGHSHEAEGYQKRALEIKRHTQARFKQYVFMCILLGSVLIYAASVPGTVLSLISSARF